MSLVTSFYSRLSLFSANFWLVHWLCGWQTRRLPAFVQRGALGVSNECRLAWLEAELSSIWRCI